MSDPAAPPPPAPPADEHGLDAAQQSLSDALGVSFTVLKVLLAVLIVVYIFSGVFQVDEQNKAVRLRFGKIVTNNNVPVEYGPGWHFGLPYPLEEVIQVPVNEQRIDVDEAFWYDVPEGTNNPAALARQPLNPLKDGFLITGDANVVHLQFVVGYKVEDVDKYIQNVGDTDRAEEIVRMAAERGIVIAMASADAKDVINRQTTEQAGAARRAADDVLRELNTGIVLQQLQIVNPSPPVQIQQSAYQLVSAAEQDRGTAIQNARQQAAETLNAVAGAAYRDLSAMIRAYEAAEGANDGPLAEALRTEIDSSIKNLQMAGPAMDRAVTAYLDAMTRTIDTDAEGDALAAMEAELLAEREQAGQALAEALAQSAQAPREARVGRPFGGEVSQVINNALAYQTQAVSRIEREYEEFLTWRDRYRSSPLLVANDIWQRSRTQVLGDGLIPTFYYDGHLRINTDLDPEVLQEQIEDMMERRRQEVNERSDELSRQPRRGR